MRDHFLRGCLAEEEHGFEVGIDHRVPVFLGKLDRIGAADDPGIVDQDVDPAKLVHSLVHNPVHRLNGGQVSRDDLRPASERAHLVGGLGRRRAADQRDIRARLCECQRDALADAGVRTGDDRNAACEIEGVHGILILMSPSPSGEGSGVGRCRKHIARGEAPPQPLP
ncbi:hypothetical protein SPHINGOAX6_71207 [Sphingomonas sp. AX6]|nr:hypothetical protein SPHINGOAX6_71207 [Sphingomonas sp. AX6]